MSEHHIVPLPKWRRLQHNPFFITAVAIAIGMLMFIVSFITYYRSDTRVTIGRLQANNQTINHESPERSANVQDPTEARLAELETTITDMIKGHSDEADYNADQLTDSALGL